MGQTFSLIVPQLAQFHCPAFGTGSVVEHVAGFNKTHAYTSRAAVLFWQHVEKNLNLQRLSVRPNADSA